MAIILVPMLLLACIRNLKYLSPVSMLANILQFSGLGIIFYYVLQDLPYSWERKPFASWGQLPLYFGTAIYAFEVGPSMVANYIEYSPDYSLHYILIITEAKLTCKEKLRKII